VKRDFLKLADLSMKEHRWLLDRAKELKAKRQKREVVKTLEGRTLALIFEKSSTRTRFSFEAAMAQLGGHAIVLPIADSQMSRGEPLVDTARVVSRYVDAIMYRTFGDDRLREMARAATVPVINGLSDGAHPVQLLADLQTIDEKKGRVAGNVVAYVGDGSSNMARSFIEAAGLFDFELRVAAPEGYQPPKLEVSSTKGVRVTPSPAEAVRGADVVVTDVWTSMGQEAEMAARLQAFQGFCVDKELMAKAKSDAIVMHCLPAHRGEEISEDVLEGPRSVVFDEAENRMHAQKALLELLLNGS